MLKDLIDIWKNRGIMIKAVDLFGQMLDDTLYVVDKSWKVFLGELPSNQEGPKIRERDKEVNRKEREIRRLLVEHLALNPMNDASGCLALMSMVKDAERIGDYAKNIFDLAVLAEKNSYKFSFQSGLVELEKNLLKSLKSIKSAFIDSDEKIAKEIMARYDEIKRECKEIIKGVFKADMNKNEAVLTVLMARYLKRINSHISNIASGIILPLDQIDFVKDDSLIGG